MISEVDIASKIYTIRGEKVMLDSDLALLFGVSTSRLNEQVKRNAKRFPSDFMFELSEEEFIILKSQNATSRWGGRRTLPKVFTEHGTIMLASILNSEIAVNTSIIVVRAFVNLREFVLMSQEINKKLEDFERKTEKKFGEHEKIFKILKETLQNVLIQEETPKNPIGFVQQMK